MVEAKETVTAVDSAFDLELQTTSEFKSKVKPSNELDLNNDKFPRSVIFIVFNETTERFSYYGIKNLLNQYLKSALGMKKEAAKSQVHLFNSILYVFPLVGAAISDSFLGKFYTIILFSIICLVGDTLLSVFSINNLIAPFGNYPFWSYILPILLIAIGTGGRKPCVAAHGSDQFSQSQSHLLDIFYSMFYVGVSAGKLITQYLTPVLKNIVSCFGSECYFLAFGTSTISMLLSVVLLLLGYRHYRIAPPQGDFLPWKAARLTFLALTRRWHASPSERQEKAHWLEFSKPEFDADFIEETRLVGKLIVISIPTIFFWALYDQSTTEWQNQYEKMDKLMFNFIPVPTEASTNLNTVLVLILTPLLAHCVYPWLEKHGFRIPLITRMMWGFFSLIMAFVLSTLLDYIVDQYTQNIIYRNNVVSSCVGCLNGGWQLPQYFLLSLGEALLNTAADQFSYTQVGPQMKATSASLTLLTTCLGNYFVFIMEYPLSYIDSPTNRQWIYVAISSCFFLWFIYLGNYWFVSKESEEEAKLKKVDDKKTPLP